jgi:hypothetical protein
MKSLIEQMQILPPWNDELIRKELKDELDKDF